jgi:uncharacterized membrane protein YeaQ/YmgE (transglycosylase-associated protein family)
MGTLPRRGKRFCARNIPATATFRWHGDHQLGAHPVSGFLWILIVGLIAGVIARFLLPGPNNPQGFVLTAVLGIAGAFVATWIGQSIGWYRPDQGAGIIGATMGALVVLIAWHRLVVQRVVNDPGITRTNWPPPRA